MTSPNGNIFCVTRPLCRESSVTGEFHSQRPVTRSFDVYLICASANDWVNTRDAGDLRHSCLLWRHGNEYSLPLARNNHKGHCRRWRVWPSSSRGPCPHQSWLSSSPPGRGLGWASCYGLMENIEVRMVLNLKNNLKWYNMIKLWPGYMSAFQPSCFHFQIYTINTYETSSYHSAQNYSSRGFDTRGQYTEYMKIELFVVILNNHKNASGLKHPILNLTT